MRVDNRGGARFRYWTAAASAAVLAVTGFAPEPVQTEQDEAHIRGHVAGRIAHHICAGLFVVGRDYERSVEEVVAQDLEPFGDRPDGFDVAVDHDTRTASVSGDGFGTRSAVYNGDQGCTILPEGFEDVVFEPLVVERRGPDPETTAHDLVVVRLGPSPGGHEAYLSGIIGRLTAAIDR